MLWLVINDASHEIISCNIHEKEGKYQLWITRPNDRSLKVNESEDRNIILEIKEAIDFAIEKGEKTLRLV